MTERTAGICRKRIGRMVALAAVWLALSFHHAFADVRQVMKPARYSRGDENVRIVQQADAAAWIWMPGHEIYGVAATAAALCLHPDETTASALAALQAPDGTFPGGDLLSTAVSLYALHRTGHAAEYGVRDFLSGCFRPTGLFAAVPADPFGDLEYTVYGLLAMGATA